MQASGAQDSTAVNNLQRDIDAEGLRVAYDRLGVSIAMTVGTTLVFSALVWQFYQPTIALTWMSVGIVVAALRLVLLKAFRRAAPAPDALAVWRHLFLAGAILAGAGWAIGPTLMIPHAQGAGLAMLTGTLLSVAAVGDSSLSTQPWAMYAFLSAALVPPAVVVWISGESVIDHGVAMLLAGLAAAIVSGRQSNHALGAMLKAQLQQRAALADAAASRNAYQQNEERYRALTEWSPEPIAVLRGGKILYFNPATVILLRANSAQDLIGITMLDMIHPDYHQMVRARSKNLIEAGSGATTPSSEMIFLKLDGGQINVEVHSLAIIYGGESAVYVSMHDITEKKQAEAARLSLESQLRESQKMEAIGTLAGGIAHDFNNILATILGNTELARQDAIHQPQTLESLDEIHKAAARARDLVQQILSFSRRQPTKLKPTRLTPIVEESARLLRATMPGRITLQVHCQADIPMVMADATQIQQVIINLATNAMQALHGNPGNIGIRLDTVTLNQTLIDTHPTLAALQRKQVVEHPAESTTRPIIRLSISDSGRGMNTATVERIFKPFFNTKPVDEGIGLGLSVVHGIVQGHDGAITVESTPDRGSTFTIYLSGIELSPELSAQFNNPYGSETGAYQAFSAMIGLTKMNATVKGAAIETTSAGTEQTPPPALPHLLYLDDDESLVFLVKRLLERRGFKISAFTDQRQALAVIRADATRFDLVVTDYNMPGISGLDVAREVRKIRADLPVAVASGFIDETLRAQASEAGVRKLIFKASGVEEFCNAFIKLVQTSETHAKDTKL